MAGSAALDDSLDFCYGQKGVDKEQHAALLENEKKNFKLLLSKVRLEYITANILTKNKDIYINTSHIDSDYL